MNSIGINQTPDPRLVDMLLENLSLGLNFRMILENVENGLALRLELHNEMEGEVLTQRCLHFEQAKFPMLLAEVGP